MQDPDCIFCKIINGDIPSTKVYEDELLFAFNDINPAAPVHVLIVPKKHIQDNNHITAEDEVIAGRMFTAAKEIASQLKIAEDGYRLIINTGRHGHQEVPHLHLHLIGGQPMQHPMG
ncbi:MAG: histidine triad nucleotide-binding protein [Anaerolineales bacterium]|nr:histidine triad nucleotide-binding protein [Anaerolineales bacterium]